MSEHKEQVALIKWCRLMEHRLPWVSLIFAIPNGGARHPGTGKKLKAEGVKKGIPDLFIPVPKGGKNGLFIEMKYGKNKPTKEQREVMARLMAQGYAVVVCWGWEEASKRIEEYWRGALLPCIN